MDKIIDSHSHISYETDNYIIGANYMWPILPNLKDYNKIAKKNNIGIVLFCPCTSPYIYDKKNNITHFELLWDYKDNNFTYYKMINGNGIKEKYPLTSNPYKKINNLIYNYLLNDKSDLIKYYIPAINLIFDTEEYLEYLISLKAIAFKVHGISIGLDNFNKINPSLLKFISEKKIPLQIHTDYTNNINSPIDKLYYANNPLNWIELLNAYNIKGYLAHGSRLSPKAAYLLKNNKNFLTGISPDILLQNEKERLMYPTNNYLNDLLKIFDENNLAFDIDYGWNIKDRINFEEDYDQLKRLMNLFKTEEQKKKILTNNAKEFFKID